MCKPVVRKGIQRIVHALSVFKGILNLKSFGVKWLRTDKFNIILKGELTKTIIN
jgi:hypothetical protein